MKKQINVGIAVIACVTLYAAVWPWSIKVEDLPAEPEETAVPAEIEARPTETSPFFISADIPATVAEVVAESESNETEITAEKETEPVQPTESTLCVVSKSAPVSSKPKSGDRTVINGKPHMWIPGFGWIEDDGGGSICTVVGGPDDELTGNKAGFMGGGTTVDGKGDIYKQVGIMDGGIVAEDMYENGHKIGIMGDDESAPSNSTPPPSEQPEPTGDAIYIELQPPVTKDCTPPPYKPNGEPYNP